MNRTKWHTALSIAIAAIVLGQSTPSSASHDPEKKSATVHANVHVRAILKKRLDVLREIARQQRTAYVAGEAGISSVIRADVNVLDAQLELAIKPDERVAIRKKTLKQASSLEAAAKKLHKAKQATSIDMLRAQAFRLRCEAELLREQSAAHHHRHHRSDHN